MNKTDELTGLTISNREQDILRHIESTRCFRSKSEGEGVRRALEIELLFERRKNLPLIEVEEVTGFCFTNRWPGPIVAGA